jgi:hypothetical protein
VAGVLLRLGPKFEFLRWLLRFSLVRGAFFFGFLFSYFSLCTIFVPGRQAATILCATGYLVALGWYLAKLAWWRGFVERDAGSRRIASLQH